MCARHTLPAYRGRVTGVSRDGLHTRQLLLQGLELVSAVSRQDDGCGRVCTAGFGKAAGEGGTDATRGAKDQGYGALLAAAASGVRSTLQPGRGRQQLMRPGRRTHERIAEQHPVSV